MSMEWWRCKHGAPFDPKWRAIALRAQARPGDVWAVFTTLCDRASQAGDRGSLSGLDLEDVAAGLGYELDEVQRIVTALKDKGLVTDERVTTWEKHQPKREDSSTERVRAHRNAMKRDETQKPAREEKRRVDTEKKEEGRKSARASRSTPPPQHWPVDAVVPEDWISEAQRKLAGHNRPPLDLRLEAEKFALYWAGRRDRKAARSDWKLTWFTWVLSDKHDGKSNGSRQPRRSSVGDTLRAIANDIADSEATRTG